MPSILTNQGRTFIADILANNKKVKPLTMRVGTGKRVLAPTVTALQTEYDVTHEIPNVQIVTLRNADGLIDTIRIEFRDVNVTKSYQATEYGVFNNDGNMIIYYVAGNDDPPYTKAADDGSSLTIWSNVTITPTQGNNIAYDVAIAGLDQATKDAHGSVQLSGDDDWASTGAVVKSPKQIDDRIKGSTPDLPDYATGAQVNAGTSEDTIMSPKSIEDSNYRKIVKLTQAQYNALNPKNADILYAIVG